MAISYVQRTIRELKNQGRVCAIVEKFNAFAGPHGIRQDLFGIIDILALDPQRGVIGVQVCGQDWTDHIRKMIDERTQETHEWLSTPGTVLELHGWRKIKKKRGGKQMIWRPRVAVFEIEDGEITYVESK